MTLSDEMARLVDEQRLGFAATVCPDGSPNLSPKGTVSVWDSSHLVFADICSPGTVANLRERPIVEINVVDPIRRKGYRFKGPARVVDAGPEYRSALEFFCRRGVISPIRSAVFVKVDRAEALISPIYDTGATEEEVVEKHLGRTLDRFRAGAGATKMRDLVTSFYADIWNRGDLSFIPVLLRDDFSFRGSLGTDTRGHAEFAKYVNAVRGALGDYRCDVLDLMTEGQRAFARMRFSGVHRGEFVGYAPSGKRVEWMSVALFTAGGDCRAADLWVLGDIHGLMAQLRTNATG